MQEAGVWVLLAQLTHLPDYCTGACRQHKWIWDPIAPSIKEGLGLGYIEVGEVREPRKPFSSGSNIVHRRHFSR